MGLYVREINIWKRKTDLEYHMSKVQIESKKKKNPKTRNVLKGKNKRFLIETISFICHHLTIV